MSAAGVATGVSRLLRRAVLATCGCATRHWKVGLSRSLAGVVVSAEVRSR
jgi:hypothetical protein